MENDADLEIKDNQRQEEEEEKEISPCKPGPKGANPAG